MKDEFAEAEMQSGETSIFVRWGGAGPPILLLHGFPQTHLMWRRVAPLLAPLHRGLRRPARLWTKRLSGFYTRSRAVLEACDGAGHGRCDGTPRIPKLQCRRA